MLEMNAALCETVGTLVVPPAPARPVRAARKPARAKAASLTVATRRKLEQHLQDVFQFKALRPGQQQVIERVLKGQSTLAIMPTGAGKSLCYQLPALMLPGCTLVVSPLIALMKDQCEKLRAHGVAAVEFNSSLDAEALATAEAALADGSARIVLVTPERLADPDFLERMQRCQVSLAVIDEAHCISEWGHDFRPAFLQIGPALKALGAPPVLALTATAPPDTAGEIARQLRIPKSGIVDTGAWRPNLVYSVEYLTRADEKLGRLLDVLQRCDEPGIVYTATVRAAEEVHAALAAKGLSAGLYHGKLNTAERNAAQEAFMAGSTRVMVATNAFGMGIDKADVRFVVHYQLPASLDAYYQESGRAGRDGLPAQCVLLFLRSDKAVQQFFMSGQPLTQADLEMVLGALSREAPASTAQVQDDTGMPKGKAAAVLAMLQQGRYCSKTRAPDGLAGWVLAPASRGQRTLLELVQADHVRRMEKQRKLEAVVDYAESGACRWNALLGHLQGDARPNNCGTCDNCRRMQQLGEVHVATPAVVVPQIELPAPVKVPSVRAFQVDDQVQVKRFGQGRVTGAAADAVVVQFADGSQRSFQPGFVVAVESGAA